MIEVRTQAQLDKALAKAKPDELIVCQGDGYFSVGGSATVRAWGSATVEASKYVAIHVDHNRWNAGKPKISGGVLIEIPKITTARQWCDYYGVEVKRGVARLFKAVGDDYSTPNARRKGIAYKPGTKPEAPDWDGGKAECGGGLHFSPRPVAARSFFPEATRFVACPVRLADIVIHKDPQYPAKIKAPRVVGPCVEVDADGEPVKAKAA